MKKINFLGVFIVLVVSALLITVGFSRINELEAKEVYMIYLNGKKIGLIEDEDELFDLIDDEQDNIKHEFKVDKVYPPDSLESVKYTTYRDNLKSAEDIYDIIEEESTFTIKGYTVTIKGEEKDPIYINILNKEDVEPALTEAVNVFIPQESITAYLNDNQAEIVDTGKTIENIYFEEKITVKESYLPVNEKIITNQSDLTQYLLFGTLEKQKEHTVKEGENLETIAFNNALSNEELLIANPTFSSINALVSPGQHVNIGLIQPLFTIVEESEVVEDIEPMYDTITESDPNMFDYEIQVKQEGSRGLSRVTEKVLYKNGEVKTLFVSSTKEITAPVNKIVVKGTKPSYSFVNRPPASSSTDWGWPTISPYIITSRWGYRWGRLHNGIDISGCGSGSPIYSSTDGVVTKVFTQCSNNGYYGSSCGSGFGNSIEIRTSNGYIITYAHLRNVVKVSEGATVSKGQLIGYMGNSGSSTGTHLHFAITDDSGAKYDPCKVAFVC